MKTSTLRQLGWAFLYGQMASEPMAYALVQQVGAVRFTETWPAQPLILELRPRPGTAQIEALVP